MLEDKIAQEFYCRHCPADDAGSTELEKRKTGGHFRCKLSVGYEASIVIACPKCKREHHRHVLGGVIRDGRGSDGLVREKIRVGLSAWSRNPLSAKHAKARRDKPHDHFQSELRGGAVLATDADKADGWEAAREAFLSERWAEIAFRDNDS